MTILPELNLISSTGYGGNYILTMSSKYAFSSESDGIVFDARVYIY